MRRILHNKFLSLARMSVLIASAVGCGGEDDPTTEQEPTYKVSINGSSTASESNPGTGFKIVLDKANQTGNSITVKYTLTGTATGGVDYETPSGSASIADGDSEITVDIPFKDDSEVEGDETLIVTLSDSGLGSNVSLSSPSTFSYC